MITSIATIAITSFIVGWLIGWFNGAWAMRGDTDD
jgi:hypothetical protein